MNTQAPNQENAFESLSPVLELIYVMVKNMQKYLKVFAEDINANRTEQYVKTYEALEELKTTLAKIYGLEEEDKMPKADTSSIVQPMVNPISEMKQAVNKDLPADPKPMSQPFSAPAPMPQPPAQPMAPTHHNPQVSSHIPSHEPVPMQAPAAPQPVQQPMQPSAAPAPQNNANEIDQILSQLRELQSSSQKGAV